MLATTICERFRSFPRRKVNELRVNLDGLKDLKGLENVDVVGHLTLFGQGGDRSPRSLEGLSDEELILLLTRGLK